MKDSADYPMRDDTLERGDLESGDVRGDAGAPVRQFTYGTLLLLFVLVGPMVAAPGSASWTLPAIAVGFVGLGAVAGFLYSSIRDEKDRSSPATIVLASLLGGAGLVDATNERGVLRWIAGELAAAAGLATGGRGLLLALVAVFVPAGFFSMYFYRRLSFTRRVKELEARDALRWEKIRAALAPAINLELDATPGGAVFRTDPAAREFAAKWLERDRAIEPGYDDLMAEARARIVLGQSREAVAPLRRALELRPTSAPAGVLLAAAYVGGDRYTEAVDLLDQLLKDDPGQAPANAWKLLGYARLFLDPARPDHASGLWLSITMTTKFLVLVPTDLGARLNRACAYGQLGPAESRARQPLFDDLKTLFGAAPEARENVRALTTEDLDFAAWKDDGEFKALLKG